MRVALHQVVFVPIAAAAPRCCSAAASHSGAAAEQAARIRRRIRAGFPLDIIVRSPAAIRKRTAMGDGFIREILEKGKVLHESHDAGVDRKSRSRFREGWSRIPRSKSAKL